MEKMESKDYQLHSMNEEKRPYFTYAFRQFEQSLKKKFRDFNEQYGIIIKNDANSDTLKYSVDILKEDKGKNAYTLEWYYDDARNKGKINEICYEIRRYFFAGKSKNLIGSLHRRGMVFSDSYVMSFIRKMIHYRNSFSHAMHNTDNFQLDKDIICFIETIYNDMPEDVRAESVNEYFSDVNGKKFLSYRGIVFCLSLFLSNEKITLLGKKIAGLDYDNMQDILYYSKGNSLKEYNLSDKNFSSIVEFLLQYNKMNNSAIPFLSICREFLDKDMQEYKLSREMTTEYNKYYQDKKNYKKNLPRKAYNYDCRHLYKVEKNQKFSLSENDIMLLTNLKIDDALTYNKTLADINTYIKEYNIKLMSLKSKLKVEHWNSKENISDDIKKAVEKLEFKDIEFLNIKKMKDEENFNNLKHNGLKEKIVTSLDDLENTRKSIDKYFNDLSQDASQDVKTVVKLLNDLFVRRKYVEDNVPDAWREKYKKLSNSLDKRAFMEILKTLIEMQSANETKYIKSINHIQNILKNERPNEPRVFRPYDKRNRKPLKNINFKYDLGYAMELLKNAKSYNEFYNKFIVAAKEKMMGKTYTHKYTPFINYIVHAVKVACSTQDYDGSVKSLSPLVSDNPELKKYRTISNLGEYLIDGEFKTNVACTKKLYDYKKIATVYKIFKELELYKKNKEGIREVSQSIKINTDTFLKEKNQQIVANLLQHQVSNEYQIKDLTLDQISRHIYIEVTKHQIFSSINAIVKEREIEATISDYNNWITNFNNLTRWVVTQIINEEKQCIINYNLLGGTDKIYVDFNTVCDNTDIVAKLTGDNNSYNKELLKNIRNYFFHQMIFFNPKNKKDKEDNNRLFYNFIFDIIKDNKEFNSFLDFFKEIIKLKLKN